MIHKKSKIRQLFCRHKNSDWFQKKSMFQSLSGETHYHICKDCGKVLGERFLEYEGAGFK